MPYELDQSSGTRVTNISSIFGSGRRPRSLPREISLEALHRGAEFLRLNPKGTRPALTSGMDGPLVLRLAGRGRAR